MQGKGGYEQQLKCRWCHPNTFIHRLADGTAKPVTVVFLAAFDLKEIIGRLIIVVQTSSVTFS